MKIPSRNALLGRSLLAVAILGITAASSDASIVTFLFNLSGANEAPPNSSPGTGSGFVSFDDVANTMLVSASFSGLQGNTTASHIHAGTAIPFSGVAGVATQTPSFSAMPFGVTVGTFTQGFNMTLASSYNASFLTANGGNTASAFTALVAFANSGRAYFNLHTTAFPAGEVRGFLTPVPEPGSTVAGMLTLGVCLSRLVKRTRRDTAATA